MALVEMVMPKMGESVMEGTIEQWFKQVGDQVEEDEAILEVSTDKVTTEIPSTHSGVIQEILVAQGEVAQVGQAIAIISTEGEAPSDDSGKTGEDNSQVIEAIEHSMQYAEQMSNGFQTEAASNGGQKPQDNRFYSPLVMSIAKTENISMAELAQIQGSGLEQRVTKKDILAYVAQRQQATQTPLQTSSTTASPQPKTPTTSSKPQSSPSQTAAAQSVSGNYDIIEMDRMRKMIAQRMVESKRISPHVTTFVEVDVTNVVLWRNKVKKQFEQREGEKLTFTPIFIEAIAKTLKALPMVNISVEGDNILVKKDINVGMATALPNNNLIVPVIKNADQMNLIGIAKKVNDLARRARENKLSPDELSGGTYSVSNIGSFGNEMGTPIIMQPQTAIMAIGAIKKKPAVIETPTGDVIAIRHMMFISHSYDHRVIDGALGGSFARKFADYLEQFDINREI